MRRRFLYLLLMAAAVALAWRPLLLGLRAAYFLLALSGHPDHPLRMVTHQVVVEPWQVEAPRGRLPARLYLPRGGGRPGVAVLLHGVVPDGMNDARLVDLARALAASGVAVMTPDLPDIRGYLLTHATLDDISAAIQSVLQRADQRWDRARAGVVGISYSGTLGLLAACRPELRGRLEYAVTFGAYYDFPDAVDFSITGRYQRAGLNFRITPHPYARIIFYYNAAREMPSLEQPEKVRQVLGLRLADRAQEAEQVRATLSPADRRSIEAMFGSGSVTLKREMEAALARHPDYLEAFSLQPHLPDLRIPHLVLVHSANDDIIPYGETVRLCRALARRSDLETYCVITRLFTHVDLESGSKGRSFWGFTVPEHARLLRAIYRVLSLAS